MMDQDRIARFAPGAFKDVGLAMLAADRLASEGNRVAVTTPRLAEGYYEMAATTLLGAVELAMSYQAPGGVVSHLRGMVAQARAASGDIRSARQKADSTEATRGQHGRDRADKIEPAGGATDERA